MKILTSTLNLVGKPTSLFNTLSMFFVLGLRLYVFKVFFNSGWVKTTTWDSTLFLFRNEFRVPFLDPVHAAYLGTAAELTLPVFILFGLGARIPALLLFIFNLTAVYSYPFLWTAPGIAGFKDHIIWGTMIGVILFYGHGKISFDNVLGKSNNKYTY